MVTVTIFVCLALAAPLAAAQSFAELATDASPGRVPLVARANGIGVSRRPPHPHAALLFYEYNLGAGQPLLVKLHYRSPLRRLATGARMLFVDPAMDGAALARCNSAFAALLKGQAWR